MYSNLHNAAKTYANVGLETGVAAASPQQLIILLYDGAELAVRMAIQHMLNGDMARKAKAISNAGSIILEGLHAALDRRQGGVLVDQLGALYEYMLHRLNEAHTLNQRAPLEEVLGLLRELRAAWQQIGSTRPQHLVAA